MEGEERMKLIAWILSLLFAFQLGASYDGNNKESKVDSELKQKVQDHLDAIVDEAAGLLDDVMEEVREDENVQKVESFVDDVKEIVDDTVNDIKDHFSAEEETEETEEHTTQTETVDEDADGES